MRSDVLRGAPGGGTVPVTKGLNGLAQVPQEVPTIGDLDGAWSALTDPVGIGASTITGDDLDAWPLTQPGSDSRGFRDVAGDRPRRWLGGSPTWCRSVVRVSMPNHRCQGRAALAQSQRDGGPTRDAAGYRDLSVPRCVQPNALRLRHQERDRGDVEGLATVWSGGRKDAAHLPDARQTCGERSGGASNESGEPRRGSSLDDPATGDRAARADTNCERAATSCSTLGMPRTSIAVLHRW